MMPAKEYVLTLLCVFLFSIEVGTYVLLFKSTSERINLSHECTGESSVRRPGVLFNVDWRTLEVSSCRVHFKQLRWTTPLHVFLLAKKKRIRPILTRGKWSNSWICEILSALTGGVQSFCSLYRSRVKWWGFQHWAIKTMKEILKAGKISHRRNNPCQTWNCGLQQ